MSSREKYQGLIQAARDVVARWEAGDLAEAVRNLEGELAILESEPVSPTNEPEEELHL